MSDPSSRCSHGPSSSYFGVDGGRGHHVVSAIARSQFEAGDVRWQLAPTLKVEVKRAGFERIGAGGSQGSHRRPGGGRRRRRTHRRLLRPHDPRLPEEPRMEVHWVRMPRVHDVRDVMHGRRTKTDPVDARLIARLLYLREVVGQEYAFATGTTRWAPTPPCARWWATLAAPPSAGPSGNQLTQILDVVFPNWPRCSSSRSAPTHAAMLERHPTSAAVGLSPRPNTMRATGPSSSRPGRPARRRWFPSAWSWTGDRRASPGASTT